ncbi:MAG: hypothetical protein J07HQW1_00172 [Haloquadratum walsbyi J07HQW1]|uniref:Uncharacterized protein n=1 Tax=Haloquadratum walsbyi J07HQW1 TaxID=1238424 RepID=U1N1E4_9EURY|nr:MAG: hypothetical protein J07HQW1_00172 [Haloquadratum walsbyi J07HQW1]
MRVEFLFRIAHPALVAEQIYRWVSHIVASFMIAVRAGSYFLTHVFYPVTIGISNQPA